MRVTCVRLRDTIVLDPNDLIAKENGNLIDRKRSDLKTRQTCGFMLFEFKKTSGAFKAPHQCTTSHYCQLPLEFSSHH